MNLQQKLDAIVEKNNSLLCVGLDPVEEKLSGQSFFEFNKSIIDVTHDLVCAYKPNSAFYEALGDRGVKELKMTCDYLRENHPEIPIIIDAKRADIGNTNEGYAKYIFDYLQADGVTLQPYLGKEAIQPFLDKIDKGIIILCRTSNPGAGEFQDLQINGEPLYMHVAKNVVEKWNTNNNCMLVVGATYPEELKQIRNVVGNMNLLVPGIGTQGGDIEKSLQAGMTKDKKGILLSTSRTVIFAQNPREEALKLRDEINTYR